MEEKELNAYLDSINSRARTIKTQEFMDIKKKIEKDFYKKAKPLPEADEAKKRKTKKRINTNKEIVDAATMLMEKSWGGVTYKNKINLLFSMLEKHPNIKALKYAVNKHMGEVKALEKPFIKNFKEGLKSLKIKKISYLWHGLTGIPFINVKANNIMRERPKKEREFYREHGIIPLRFEVFPATHREMRRFRKSMKFMDHPIIKAPAWFEALVIGNRIYFYEMQTNKEVSGLAKDYHALPDIMEHIEVFGGLPEEGVMETHVFGDVSKTRAILQRIGRTITDGFMESLFKKYLDDNMLELYFKNVREGVNNKKQAAMAEEFADLVLELHWAMSNRQDYKLGRAKKAFFDDLVDACYSVRKKLSKARIFHTSLTLVFPFLLPKDNPFEVVGLRIPTGKPRRTEAGYSFMKDLTEYRDIVDIYQPDTGVPVWIYACKYRSFLDSSVPSGWLEGMTAEMEEPPEIENATHEMEKAVFWQIKEITDPARSFTIGVETTHIEAPKEASDLVVDAILERADCEVDEKEFRSLFNKVISSEMHTIHVALTSLEEEAPRYFSIETRKTEVLHLGSIMTLHEIIKEHGSVFPMNCLIAYFGLNHLPVFMANLEWMIEHTNLKKEAAKMHRFIEHNLKECKHQEIVERIRKAAVLVNKKVRVFEKGKIFEKDRIILNIDELKKYMIFTAKAYKETIAPLMPEKITEEDIKQILKATRECAAGYEKEVKKK